VENNSEYLTGYDLSCTGSSKDHLCKQAHRWVPAPEAGSAEAKLWLSTGRRGHPRWFTNQRRQQELSNYFAGRTHHHCAKESRPSLIQQLRENVDWGLSNRSISSLLLLALLALFALEQQPLL
jgi:hypothetical protein